MILDTRHSIFFFFYHESRHTPMTLNAEILTTGTEILLGEIVDTNAAWMAQQLREIGVNLFYKTTVGDNEARVREVITLGMGRSDVILVTGGLGPTADDITREAIAGAAGRPLLLNEPALAQLREQFARWGYHAMSENNVQQAYIPQDAIVIENPVGTAPGFIVETERCAIIAMPGVPREMKRMMADSVLPYLSRRNGDGGVIRRRVLRTVGIGESNIDTLIRDLMAGSNPTIGLAAHTGQVDVRITARAATAQAAEALIDAMHAQVSALIGRHIYSTTPDEAVESVVARQLVAAGFRVALVESNTDGVIARRLSAGLADVDVVAASWVLGQPLAGELPATIAQPPDLLTPSPEAAAASAVEVQGWAAARADDKIMGVVILGSGGQDGGAYGQAKGETIIALAWPDQSGTLVTHTARFPYAGSDDLTVAWIGNRCLDLIRRLTPTG